jgi:hypothetical protein
MLRKTMLVTALSVLLLGGSSLKVEGSDAQQEKGGGPVIIDYYAPQIVRPGATWKIFLHAEGRKADMKYIAAILSEAGVGEYPTDFTWIKAGDRRELSGYLFFNIPSDQSFMGDRFELTLLIRDSEGNRSESVTLPLRIDYAPAEKPPQEWEAAANYQLGTIMVNIQSSQQYNRGDGSGGNYGP